jgi:hypothetical protein
MKKRPRTIPDPNRNWSEHITVQVDGKEYMGSAYFRDLGLGKVMFEVWYGGLYHRDGSLFRRNDVQTRLWAEIEIQRLVRKSLEQSTTPI